MSEQGSIINKREIDSAPSLKRLVTTKNRPVCGKADVTTKFSLSKFNPERKCCSSATKSRLWCDSLIKEQEQNDRVP